MVNPNQAPTANTYAVPLSTLLGEYSDNEVRADVRYKQHWIRTSGIVGEVKKDITDSPYVTIGNGSEFQIPVVQCLLADDQVTRAASFSKGDRVKIVGRVDGLMMNVIMRDCRFE